MLDLKAHDHWFKPYAHSFRARSYYSCAVPPMLCTHTARYQYPVSRFRAIPWPSLEFGCIDTAADEVPSAAHDNEQEPRGRPVVRQGFRTGTYGMAYWRC